MALRHATYHNIVTTYFTKIAKPNTGLTLFLKMTPLHFF